MDPFGNNQPRPPATPTERLGFNVVGGACAFFATAPLHEATEAWLSAYTLLHYGALLSVVAVLLAWPGYATAIFAITRMIAAEIWWHIKWHTRR